MRSAITILLSCILSYTNAQSPYEMSAKTDLALMGSGLMMFTTSLILGPSQEPLTEARIQNLDKDDIWSFDRGATDNFSQSSGVASDVFRAVSWTAPLAILASNRTFRQDYKVIALMSVETYLINTGITSLVKLGAGRIRPFVYNPEVDLERKTSRSARRSFFSGHTSTSASFAFLMLRFVTDYYDDPKLKVISWIGATSIPTLVAYLRVRAGKHYPSDVITGFVVGGLVGYFIPELHKKKSKEAKLSLNVTSLYGTPGMRLAWKL